MELTSHPHLEPRLRISIAVLLNIMCVIHGLLWGDIYITCTICLIWRLMQYSLTVIPANTNLPLTNNCTLCIVSADSAGVYKIQLPSVQNNLNHNI